MNILSLCAAGVIACMLTLIIRQYKPEMSMLLVIAGSLLISISLLKWISPIIGKILSLADKYNAKENIALLIKAVGICFITQSAADTCRDSNCSSLAGKIETAGKIAVLAVVFPMFEKILQSAVNIMDGQI